MLDWVKDKIGRKQTALEALVSGSFKDDVEKQALLGALATTEGLRAEELLPLLTHADGAIQQRTGMLFLARASPSSASALVDAVLSAEGGARGVLLKTLVRVKADLLRPALDVELRETKPERLRAAWELAIELPPEISDGYVERAFKEGPPRARFEALRRMIAKRPVAEMRSVLVQALDDREARVRRAAVDALVKLEGNDVFEALLDRIVRDDNVEIRKIAGGYLQKFIATAPADLRPAILGRLLLSGDAEVRLQLVTALFASGSHHDLLLEILTFAKTVLGTQHAAILDSLQPLGVGLVEHAIRILTHEDADLRIQAILLLERFSSPKTIAAILKLLQDGDWWVRIMACEALGRLKDARTLQSIERLLGDPECKWAAIDAIGSIGGDGAFAALLGLIKDKQVEVRLAAMNALGKLEDRRVDNYVEDVAKGDVSLDLRIRAVELLRARRGAVSKGSVEASISSVNLTRPMEKLFAYAREAGGSDLHVTPGEPPFLRVSGVIQRLDMKPLTRGQVDTLVDDILDPVRRPILAEKGAVDFCYSIPGVGRYRVNVFRQLRGTSAVVRVIPNVTPTLAAYGLPRSVEEIGMYHQGIILLTGAAGSGKSTSLTAIVNLLNETRNTHILTLEDPIEFLHVPKKALVNQREIGRDSKSFAAAMRGALREDPDVIVVGELRDKETIRLAMVAAETGHLVIATMQTTGAIATVDKVVESFPSDEQAQIRMQFSGSLKLVISQTLVPRASGSGRVAAFEILKATSPVCAIIRDGKTFQLGSAMQIGRTQGMLTLDASLEQLLMEGQITLETAFAYAQKKDAFGKGSRAARDAKVIAHSKRPPKKLPALDISSTPEAAPPAVVLYGAAANARVSEPTPSPPVAVVAPALPRAPEGPPIVISVEHPPVSQAAPSRGAQPPMSKRSGSGGRKSRPSGPVSKRSSRAVAPSPPSQRTSQKTPVARAKRVIIPRDE